MGAWVGSASPRVLYDRLVEDVIASLRAGGDLSTPTRVIVSSRAQREQLMTDLARASRGGAWLGLRVDTLRGVALEILGRKFGPLADRSLLMGLVHRRAIEQTPPLVDALGDFEDGLSAAEPAVRDFLDAGFDPRQPEAVLEALRSLPDTPSAALAAAIVQAAALAAAEAETLGASSSGMLYARATDLLREDPQDALPSRWIAIHGFPDATGRASELLEALVRSTGASCYFHLPGAARPTEPGLGASYTARLSGRLQSACRETQWLAAVEDTSELDCFNAVGTFEEAREVARRVGDLVASGVRPESIAVVARQIDPYLVPLALAFGHAGIPFSAKSPMPAGLTPIGRAIDAATTVIEQGSQVRFTTLEGAIPPRGLYLGSQPGFRLRPTDVTEHARKRGCRRWADLSRLPTTESTPPRTAAIRAHAEQWTAWLDAGPSHPTPAAIGAWVSEFLLNGLQWERETHLAGAAERIRATLVAADSPTAELTRAEWANLVAAAGREVHPTPVGGAGGGVQILGALQARGLRSGTLFLLGLNRGVFPRPITEDPLVGDPVRMPLRAALPDLPLKVEGHDEERYLFHHLVSSAERTVLSWQRATVEGQPLARSVFVETLELQGRLQRVHNASPADGAPSEKPHEAAVEGGLPLPAVSDALGPALTEATTWATQGRRRAAVAALAIHAENRPPEELTTSPEALAEARRQAVEAWDPRDWSESQRPTPSTVSPFWGLVGRRRVAPGAERELSVTVLEGLARCPWRAFVTSVLRLAGPTPDTDEPVDATPNLLGIAVHRAVQRLATGTDPGPNPFRSGEALWAEPAAGEATPKKKPTSGEVGRALQEVSAALEQEQGPRTRGLSVLLESAARPYVDAAIEELWAQGSPTFLGVERRGLTPLEHLPGRSVAFRADLVCRRESEGGGPEWVALDLKTGRPPSTAATEKTRAKHFASAVATGELLQAAAYAQAPLGQAAGPARGEYLHVRPDLADTARQWTARADDENAESFQDAAATLVTALDRGAFLPRLEDTKGNEPAMCGYCEVAPACVRGDSGQRRRLREWLESEASHTATLGPLARALWTRDLRPAEPASDDVLADGGEA